ncbi:Ref family recombination enhancement nuclease [uncultured Endozoicomonas sp.]|uniref:Ref family recombination enhancement nuclease n=1 Tax=uncultured Endozoicomonas sp. TaxID=432652 RepID=UPI0026349F9E|nr:Ref family recombination enhancement nuclease [uncultured Endozoicomonas sp.]
MNKKQYMSLAARVGCLACELLGIPDTPAQLHHPRAGQGMSQRASDYDVIPLCPAHHTGSALSVHMTPIQFKLLFGTESQLVEMTQERVADLKAQAVGAGFG